MDMLMVTPNIAEGTDKLVIDSIANVIRTHKDVRLMDVSFDVNHNRSVFCFLGDAEALLDASKSMALKALELIDMRKHKGQHPRVGAVDAVPFVPVGNTQMSTAIQIAHAFGKFMGEQGIPVYYYGEADTKPSGNKAKAGKGKLTQELLGEYEGLQKRLSDDTWPPDEGPRLFSAKSGASTVAARGHLICFNVNLSTDKLLVAKEIAKVIRFSSGGYRDVQAMGFALEDIGLVQVSIMTSRADAFLPRLLETIKFEAAKYGVSIVSTEINGPIPLESLQDVFRHYLQAHTFKLDQIVENSIASLLMEKPIL